MSFAALRNRKRHLVPAIVPLQCQAALRTEESGEPTLQDVEPMSGRCTLQAKLRSLIHHLDQQRAIVASASDANLATGAAP
jgi:hypothetical protein